MNPTGAPTPAWTGLLATISEAPPRTTVTATITISHTNVLRVIRVPLFQDLVVAY
jgi:hypothetical protein